MTPSSATLAEPQSRQATQRLVRQLSSGKVALSESDLDHLVASLLAAGDTDLLGKLVLALHGSGAVKRARTVARTGTERFPNSLELGRIARLIGPPRVAKAGQLAKENREADLAWL